MTGRAHTIEAGSTRREPVAGSTGASAPAPSSLWPLIGVVLFLGYWGVVKANLFEQLAYTSDLFSTIQISRSWMDGRPLLSENAFGGFADLHNVYALLVLGPATALFGAYGLFVPYLLLLALGTRWVFLLVSDDRARLLISAFILGPTGFWLWDNPIYGFHPELFLAPVGILYAAALAQRSRLRWLLLLALFSIHEQGPLVGMGIHIAFVMSGPGERHRKTITTLVRIVGSYGCLFAAGLMLLNLNSQGQSRVGEALSGLVGLLSNPVGLDSLLRDLFSWVVLVVPLVAVIVLFSRRRMWTAIPLALGPLLAVAIVGRSLYSDTGLGLTWAPRLVGVWTVGTAAIIYSLHQLIWPPRSRWQPLILVAAIAVLVGYQAWALRYVRDYDFGSRFAALPHTDSLARRFTDTEFAAMECISASLDRRVHIATNGDLFAKFHMNSIVWPDRLASAWKPPQVIVCDAGGRTVYGVADCHSLIDDRSGQRFDETRIDGLRVAYEERNGPAINRCLHPISKQ